MAQLSLWLSPPLQTNHSYGSLALQLPSPLLLIACLVVPPPPQCRINFLLRCLALLDNQMKFMMTSEHRPPFACMFACFDNVNSRANKQPNSQITFLMSLWLCNLDFIAAIWTKMPLALQSSRATSADNNRYLAGLQGCRAAGLSTLQLDICICICCILPVHISFQSVAKRKLLHFMRVLTRAERAF